MKIRNVDHDTIRPYLKSSKSEPLDNGPYELERCRGESWWTIRDASQFIVGQMTDRQVEAVAQYQSVTDGGRRWVSEKRR